MGSSLVKWLLPQLFVPVESRYMLLILASVSCAEINGSLHGHIIHRLHHQHKS